MFAKCPQRDREHERQEFWQSAAEQSGKRVLPRVQRARYNLGEARPFQPAVPALNERASAVCGWLHRGERDNQIAAQHSSRAEFSLCLYTAKRIASRLHQSKPFDNQAAGNQEII